MQNEQALIEVLYRKWVNKQASPREIEELFDLLARVDIDSNLAPLMKARWEQGTEGDRYDEARQAEIIKGIVEKYPPADDKVVPLKQYARNVKMAWFRYAAAIIFLFGIFYLWETARVDKPQSIKLPAPVAIKVIPGGNKALLTLGDGSTILLDSAVNGQLVKQGGATVVKSTNGAIVYTSDRSILNQLPVYNTMSTPRGGNYRLQLPDGTWVWLNAASSITFPTAFAAKKRNVKITGEVYFEVAKNENKPFHVQVNESTQIEVLGTHFNINAYKEEATINATLLEGSIRIKNDKGTKVLSPGQQAQIEPGGATLLKNDVDLQMVMAWKNDEFQFGDKADFPAIMRQISRWYDVEVEYKGTISGHLGGSISRKADISMVLQMLEKASGMKFELEGKKVFVSP